MQKMKRILPLCAIVLWDIVSVVISFYLGIKLVYLTGMPPVYAENLPLFLTALSVIVIAFNCICGCYNRVWSSFSFRDILFQTMSVLMGVTVIIVTNIISAETGSMPIFSKNTALSFYVIWTLTLLVLSIYGRGFARFVSTVRSAFRKNKEAQTPVVVYGAGESGSYLQKTGADLTNPIRVVSFIDDEPSLWGKFIGNAKVLGGFDKLHEALEKTGAKQVVVAIPTATRSLLQDVLNVCKEHQCTVRRFGTIDDANPSDMKVSDINLEDLLHRGSVHLNMDVVENFIKGRVVLVSGGAGSIGSELCRQALRFGCKQLVVLDFNENGLFHIGNELEENYSGKYALRLASIRDRNRLEEVFSEFSPEIVFHAAAHKHVPMMELNPREAIKNNVLGTVNMCQVAITHKVAKFITISTDKAVNPTNIMGASKRITELIMQMVDAVSDTEFAAVRFGNVLGSNGSVVPFFKKQIEKGGPVTVTHPEMRRYFMTIPEACQLVLEAGAMAGGGEIFVLDMGEPVLISDLARDMIRLSGLEPDKDIEIIYTGLRPGEKLFEEISLADEDVDRTTNKKIMIMKPMVFDHEELARTVKNMEEAIRQEDDPTMFALVKDLVPTFNHNKNN
ncbi:MAG: polysaccharide biosynthesis protein [Clostridia bacterium]|nr:polysaccharide biosynthesis protein [Clostridia bacterium]